MQRILFILGFLAVINAKAQNKSLDTLTTEQGYIHSIVQSSQNHYLAYGVASYYQKILDSNYQEIASLPLNALWGGGGITFSANEEFVGYYAYGDVDTLKVSTLATKYISKMVFNDIQGIEFTAKDKIMFVYGEETLYLVNVHKQKIVKKKALTSGIYAADFDSQTNTIYVLTDGQILAFSSKNLKFISEVCETTSKSTRLWVNDGHIAVENDEKLELYNLQTTNKIVELEPNLGYITDVLLESESIIVCGRKPELFIRDLNEERSYRFKLFVNDRGIFGIVRNHKNKLLVGDANHLYQIY